ncbi:MAG: hypothetical protein RR341_01820, partial [Bacteroidales bacterium]
MSYRIYALILLFLSTTVQLSAQTLEAAKAMYKDGKYAEAKETFYQNLKKRTSDATLNHWYGVCLYMTGEKEKAIPYLEKAAQKKVQDAYLYLGNIYYDVYRFDEAAIQYEKYLESIRKNKGDTSVAVKYIEKAERAAGMLKRTEAVVIIDSMIVNKTDFLRNYKLSSESGELLYWSDIFKNSKETSDGTVYKNQRADKVIYSHPDKSGLYRLKERAKMDDGNWSEEMDISSINSDSSNNTYPFLMNDGLTLYYASDNDSLSIGNYDIFVTRKNLNTGSYLSSENVGMPFNSPFNDYMMAIDELNEVGWFASDRYQPAGKLIIYLFIPSEERQMYDDLQPASIIPYAKIKNIAATWREGADYSSLLSRIYKITHEKKEEPKADFIFIVKPGLIYTNLSQFKSPEAKALFKKGTDAEKEIEKTKASLVDLREKYRIAKKRTDISTQILKLEEYIKTLY